LKSLLAIWWLGTVGSSGLSWANVASSSTAPFPNGQAAQNSSIVNLTGSDQILAWTSANGGNIWLASFSGSAFTWGQAQPAGPFNNPANNSGKFWCANFLGAQSGSQILFCTVLSNGFAWSLGTLSGNSALSWQSITSDTPSLFNLALIWVGNFTGGGDGDHLLVADVSTGNWWLASLLNGSLSWALVSSGSSTPFGTNVQVVFPGKFLGGSVMRVAVYNPAGGNWWLSSFSGGVFFWINACNTTSGVNLNSTQIGASGVGSIAWPSGGIPGRGIEIALDPTVAFSFLQNQIFGGIIQNNMLSMSNPQPLLGYISIRICPPTTTLMGMQQYSPYSVMVEIVGYRSPEADALMDALQTAVLAFNKQNGPSLGGMLHWGLENDQLQASDLANTPLAGPLRPSSSFTKLSAFTTIRKFLIGSNNACFDNNFTKRLGL
jgi:hypothetical protein